MLVELELLNVFAGLHHGGVLKSVAEPECTVMMEVVAQEHVGRRRLRRGRLEGGMRLVQSHDRQPAVVGNAQHADLAIMPAEILDQPVDRVVGVGALVDRFGVGRVARGAA